MNKEEINTIEEEKGRKQVLIVELEIEKENNLEAQKQIEEL